MMDGGLTELRRMRQLLQEELDAQKREIAAKQRELVVRQKEIERNAAEIARLRPIAEEGERRRIAADRARDRGFRAVLRCAGTPEEKLAILDAALTESIAILDGKG